MGRVRTVAAKKYHGSDDNSDEEMLAKKSKRDVTPSTRRASGRAAASAKATPPAKATPTAQRASGRLQRSTVDKDASSSSSSSSSEDEDEAAPPPTEKPKKASPNKALNGEAKPGLKRGRKPKNDEPEDHYEVEAILDHKVEDDKKFFYIRWKGYDASADSWERQRDIKCPALIVKYYEKHPEAQLPAKRRNKRKKIKFQVVRKLKIDEEPDYDDECDDGKDYEVGRILDVVVHRNNKREFLIRWKGYSSKVDSWEPEENLNCRDLIDAFMDKVEAAKGTIMKDLRPVRMPTQRFTLATQATGRRLSKRNFGRQRASYYDCED